MKNSEEFIITRRILHLGTLLINNRQEEFEKYDLTFVQAESLIYFDKIKGAKAIDLKKHLSVSHQAARTIIDRMRKKGYLYLEVSREDARAKHVYLTESGQVACDELKRLGSDDGYQLLKNMNCEERKQILEFLKKMIENIS